MKPLALSRGGGERKYSALLFETEIHFMPKQSAAERGDVTNTFASTKRVVRSAGADFQGIKRARKMGCSCRQRFRRKAFCQKLWSHAPRKACPGAEYNGHEFQRTLLQRVFPVAEQNGLNQKSVFILSSPTYGDEPEKLKKLPCTAVQSSLLKSVLN